MIWQRYGVGFGPALLSRRTGNLRHAANELIRIIRAGYDGRRATILPVETCPECRGAAGADCGRCKGFRYVVAVPGLSYRGDQAATQNRDACPAVRVYFMSGPKANADTVRTWLIKADGEPSYLVRFVPRGGITKVTCDCPAGRAAAGSGEICEHVKTVASIDARKFAEGK
jgi:hypothetical protein